MDVYIADLGKACDADFHAVCKLNPNFGERPVMLVLIKLILQVVIHVSLMLLMLILVRFSKSKYDQVQRL